MEVTYDLEALRSMRGPASPIGPLL